MSSAYRIEGSPTGSKRERFYFATKAATEKDAAERNRQISAYGTQVSLGDVERTQAAQCWDLLWPFGASLIDACRFYVAHLEKQNGSVTVAEFCHAVRKEFDRRLEHNDRDSHSRSGKL